MTWIHYIVLAIIVIIILLPVRLDPAIRLKEYFIKKEKDDS